MHVILPSRCYRWCTRSCDEGAAWHSSVQWFHGLVYFWRGRDVEGHGSQREIIHPMRWLERILHPINKWVNYENFSLEFQLLWMKLLQSSFSFMSIGRSYEWITQGTLWMQNMRSGSKALCKGCIRVNGTIERYKGALIA